jgi:cell volume regulation protein A
MAYLEVFIAIGGIILIGFLGSLFFDKTRIPDILILIAIGLFLGPEGLALMSRSSIEELVPVFSLAALIIILFDAGLNLKFATVSRGMLPTTIYAISSFVLAVITTTLIAKFFLDLSFSLSMILGATLGGTASATVIGIAAKMKIEEDTKTILILESVLSDVLCISVVITMIDFFLVPGSDISRAAKFIASAFAIAIVLGGATGIIWIKILMKLKEQSYSYMLTIGVLFLLYSASELLGGSGSIAALLFGLVLGNREILERVMNIEVKISSDQQIKQFHSEITFIIRTFFFVALGMSITFIGFGTTTLLTGVFVILGIVGGRFIITLAMAKFKKMERADRNALLSIFPRGLAAAVLATLPYQSGIVDKFMNDQLVFITFSIIVGTTIWTTIATFLSERAYALREEDQEIVKSE